MLKVAEHSFRAVSGIGLRPARTVKMKTNMSAVAVVEEKNIFSPVAGGLTNPV